METAIEVKNLWWKYFGNQDWTLNSINFSVRSGECIGIVGPTGAGKTTLLTSLTGLIPKNFPGTMKGEVYIEGTSTRGSKIAELASRVGMVFEDPEAEFVALSVEDDIAFGLENLNLSPNDIEERTNWVLEVVGLTGYEKRNPLELSGGEKQRAAIAGVLAMKPNIILLDEPTAELDPVGKAQVLATIKDLKENYGTTIVIVEQDTELLPEIVDRLILINNGSVVMDESPESFFSKSEVLETHSVRPLEIAQLLHKLQLGGVNIDHLPLNEEEAAASLMKLMKER